VFEDILVFLIVKYLRITRELNQNKKDFKKMKPETIEKYKIKYDDKTKKYISLLNSNH
jgi:hypothetical protein